MVNIIPKTWLAIIRYGHQLLVKSMTKVLTEDEAMAYYAICRFIKIKAEADTYELERYLENERSTEAERGGT